MASHQPSQEKAFQVNTTLPPPPAQLRTPLSHLPGSTSSSECHLLSPHSPFLLQLEARVPAWGSSGIRGQLLLEGEGESVSFLLSSVIAGFLVCLDPLCGTVEVSEPPALGFQQLSG